MTEMKQNFSVEAMTQLGKDVGNQLEGVADEILMSRGVQPGDDLDEESLLDDVFGVESREDLDEESQRILSELLRLTKTKKD